MEKTVNIRAAKTQLSRLIAEAEAGAKIVIARAGKPAVRLVPVKKGKAVRKIDRKPGLLKNKIWIARTSTRPCLMPCWRRSGARASEAAPRFQYPDLVVGR